MKNYVETYRYSSNVTILPCFKHDFQMSIVKSYQGRHYRNMPLSQNDWSRSRLNKTLLVK